MPNVHDKRPVGERTTAKRLGGSPVKLSQIEPLPCYPNLKRILRSWTSTLLLTYLEIHHPAQQDPQGALRDSPITLSIDHVCEALQVSSRTLLVTLCVLCSRFRTEDQRMQAARAAREFLNPLHSTNGAIKHYSMTGPSSSRPGTVVILRRNSRLIARTLQLAGITRIEPTVAPINIQLVENETRPNPLSFVPKSGNNSRIIDILLKDSVLSGDRRSERYPRLRKAVAEGLEGAEVLQIRQNARKRGFIPESGTDGTLGE